MTLGAPGDTWGISGPRFLAVYLVSAAVAVLVGLIVRYAVVHGRPTNRPLTGEELAYVAGGADRAVLASATRLRMAGAVTVDGAQLVATGSPPGYASPLDRAVHQALFASADFRTVRRSPHVVAALADLGRRLVADGQLLAPERRQAVPLAVLPTLVVGAFGVARLLAGIRAGKPVDYLIISLIVTFVVVVLFAVRVPHATHAGRGQVRRVRDRNTYLSPRLKPSWATYGPEPAALGVALFGAAAVWAADPTLAASCGLSRKAALSSTSTGSGGCGGGSSCGGGSCGGGCGGGCGG